MMTKEFRVWLTQSYTECDEVCDALEAEQQRLKRIYHSKEQVSANSPRCSTMLHLIWHTPIDEGVKRPLVSLLYCRIWVRCGLVYFI